MSYLVQMECNLGSENSGYSTLLPSEDEDLSLKYWIFVLSRLNWLKTNAMFKESSIKNHQNHTF